MQKGHKTLGKTIKIKRQFFKNPKYMPFLKEEKETSISNKLQNDIEEKEEPNCLLSFVLAAGIYLFIEYVLK